MKDAKSKTNEIAILAAGCFWGVQAIYDQIPGVIKTIVGYIGGKKEYINPSYQLVCSGKTNHAEATQIEFNPKKITYEKILEIFWMNHNPTTPNRQGPDIGNQYRSAIFYTNEKQKKTAIKSKEDYQNKLLKPIVTEITKATNFYPAENYHQKYYKTHSISCHVNLPK